MSVVTGLLILVVWYYWVMSKHKKKQETALAKMYSIGFSGWKINYSLDDTFKPDEYDSEYNDINTLEGVFNKQLTEDKLFHKEHDSELKIRFYKLIKKTSGGYKQKHTVKINGVNRDVTEELIMALREDYKAKMTPVFLILDSFKNSQWKEIDYSDPDYYMLELFDIMLKINDDRASSHLISEIRKYKQLNKD